MASTRRRFLLGAAVAWLHSCMLLRRFGWSVVVVAPAASAASRLLGGPHDRAGLAALLVLSVRAAVVSELLTIHVGRRAHQAALVQRTHVTARPVN